MTPRLPNYLSVHFHSALTQAYHEFVRSCVSRPDESTLSSYWLPPAYVARREGNSFTLLVCPHLGGDQSGDSAGGGGQPAGGGGWSASRGGSVSRGGGQPAGGGGSAKIEQQNEYSLHGGAVCFLRSRRRAFLLLIVSQWLHMRK